MSSWYTGKRAAARECPHRIGDEDGTRGGRRTTAVEEEAVVAQAGAERVVEAAVEARRHRRLLRESIVTRTLPVLLGEGASG